MRFKYRDYQSLFKNGKVIYGKYVIFYYKEHPFTVIKTACKKKVGNSVKRSFYKRRLRHILKGFSFNSNYFILCVKISKYDINFEKEKQFLFRLLKRSIL